MIPITPKLILTGKETYDPEYSNVSNFDAMEAMKEFAIEILKYNLKQYKFYNFLDFLVIYYIHFRLNL